MTTTVIRRDPDIDGPAAERLIECPEPPLEALARCLTERLANDSDDLAAGALGQATWTARWPEWLTHWLAGGDADERARRLLLQVNRGNRRNVSIDAKGRLWIWVDGTSYGIDLHAGATP